MNRYEGMFLIDPIIANKDWDGVVKHVQDILTKHGSEILLAKKWDERKLAYTIGKHSRGTFLLVRFNTHGSAISTIRKECEISDKIIRTLIVRDESPLEQDQIWHDIESQKSGAETVQQGYEALAAINSPEGPGKEIVKETST